MILADRRGTGFVRPQRKTMSLYGYENQQRLLRRIVIIHTSGCEHYQDGKGNDDGGDAAVGKWHGPFASVKRAHRELHRLPGIGITRLHTCVPRTKSTAS